MFKRLIIIIAVLGLLMTSFFFSFSKGLVTSKTTKDNIDYIIEYKSSISDNNLVIEIGKILYIPFFFFYLFRIKKDFFFTDFLVASMIIFIQFILYFSVFLDGCSIIKTVFIAGNFFLLVHFISYLIFSITTLIVFIKFLKKR